MGIITKETEIFRKEKRRKLRKMSGGFSMIKNFALIKRLSQLMNWMKEMMMTKMKSMRMRRAKRKGRKRRMEIRLF